MEGMLSHQESLIVTYKDEEEEEEEKYLPNQKNDDTTTPLEQPLHQHSFIFVCQLCSQSFSQQLKFFEHLKSHYNSQVQGGHVHNETIQDFVEIQTEQVQMEFEVVASPTEHDCINDIPLSSSLLYNGDPTATSTMHHNDNEVIQMPHKKFGVQTIISAVDEFMKKTNSKNKSKGTNKEKIKKEKPYQEEIVFEDTPCLVVDNTNFSLHEQQQQQRDELQDGEEEDEHSLGDIIEEEEEEETTEFLVTVTDELSCTNCNEPFLTKENLKDHMEKVHGVEIVLNDFPSTESSSSSSSSKISKRGVGQKKQDVLKCTECERIFNHRNSLIYHMRTHTQERPHQCDVCKKSFFATSALKVHMRLHSGEKPYKCECCGRFFRQWGDLKYHMISIHSDIRQYQCEFCMKRFARKYSLVVHRRIHTNERNYKCEFCEKCFRAASYLQNHRRIHTGEKPHMCSILFCGKKFRVRSDLKRHIQSHNRTSNVSKKLQQGVSSTETTTTTTTIPLSNTITIGHLNDSTPHVITFCPEINELAEQCHATTTIHHQPTTTSPTDNMKLEQTQQLTINDDEVVITSDTGEEVNGVLYQQQNLPYVLFIT